MTSTVFTNTATKARTKTGAIFAFGRHDDFAGKPASKGGYIVYELCENYSTNVRGGIAKTWRCVAINLFYDEAVKLLNKRVKFKAFKH